MLQQFDAVDVVADLDQVAHQELAAAALGAGRHFAAAHYVGLGQHRWVERPPEHRGRTRTLIASRLPAYFKPALCMCSQRRPLVAT